eukprot:CAMPEP_0118936882 /NCGR_PEP_ID=MMETSP1169-20130426/20820_1 /TAXON_ID=36882 /ORGANISM="Pyramimonas obovata, Strain CCMP722" /LENGTH=576 /DNA_ID=CAMNT_0006880313 /DNA_START=154 /DNA_END=1881 /DNA_ORIENTATION=+
MELDDKSPPTPIKSGKTVAFSNLSYSVTDNQKTTKEPKILLQGLNGVFYPGEMTALMGASGAGKTTLLDVLAGRKTVGTLKGEILLGSSKPTRNQLRHEMGYVEQFDTLVPTLTVQEMLMYTAELKRPMSESLAVKTDIVGHVVKELGLKDVKDTLIGNSLARGVSGGQAKRVNIGLGMLTEPRVLFLDEPTTGLDSATADDVMQLVQTLATKGRTVVCTIHSPSSQVFRCFSKLYLLHLGRCVFFGDPHKQAVPYFESLGYPYLMGDSISDYVVFTTGGGTKGNSGFDFESAYEASPMAEEAKKSFEAVATRMLKEEEVVLESSDSDASQRPFSIGRFLHELRVLLKYRSWSNYKDGQYIGQRLGDKVLFSLILMSLYWGQGGETNVPSMYNTSALLLLLTVLPSYGAAAYVPSLVMERPLFFRERNDGCFYTVSYLIAKAIEEAIISTVFSAYFITVLYFTVDLQGSWFTLLVTFYLTLQCGIMLGYTCGAALPNMETANAVLPTYVTTCLFFMGFFIIIDDVPDGWRWYTNIVHMRYAFQAMMINNYENNENVFLEDKLVLNYYGMDNEGSAW